MLQGKLLKNHAGIMLMGDYLTLRELHRTLSDADSQIQADNALDPNQSIIALAYDVRKAYEQQREIVQPPEHYPEIGLRFGVKVLWPTFLYQTAKLRMTLSFFDHDKSHQAQAYALESVAESCIKEAHGAGATKVLDQYQRLRIPEPTGHVTDFHARCALFCSWSKRERRSRLPELLRSFDAMHDTWYALHKKNGTTGTMITPEELQLYSNIDDYPDPRW